MKAKAAPPPTAVLQPRSNAGVTVFATPARNAPLRLRPLLPVKLLNSLLVLAQPGLQICRALAAVGTVRIVDAVFGDHKSLHDLAAHEVSVNDFVNIGHLDSSIPDAGRIDDHTGTVFALVQATTAIGTHRGTKTSSPEGFLEGRPEKLGALGITATPRVALGPLVPANEEMMSVLGHGHKELAARKYSRISFSAAGVNAAPATATRRTCTTGC